MQSAVDKLNLYRDDLLAQFHTIGAVPADQKAKLDSLYNEWRRKYHTQEQKALRDINGKLGDPKQTF